MQVPVLVACYVSTISNSFLEKGMFSIQKWLLQQALDAAMSRLCSRHWQATQPRLLIYFVLQQKQQEQCSFETL